AALQRLHMRAEAAVSRRGRPGIRDRQRTIVRPGLCHRDLIPPRRQRFDLTRRLSSSFSRAIIFNSRPTTTSSNFSRSRIFSCSSLLDFSRSRTTCSYARMSRRMPIAPMTLPSASRSAEALRVVGITSPLALRGLSRSASGEVIPTTLNASALRDADGKVIGAIGILRDMRAYEQVVRDLEKSNSELQEKILDLEKFEEVVVGRELKMIALEKELESQRKEQERLKAERRLA